MTTATRAQTGGALAMLLGTGTALISLLGVTVTLAPTLAAMM